MTAKARFFLLSLGITALFLFLAGRSFMELHSALEDYVARDGIAATVQGARMIDSYLERLESATLSAGQVVRHLYSERGLRTKAELEPVLVSLLRANRDRGVQDIFFASEAEGFFADGTAWSPPSEYDPRERSWYREAVAAGRTVLSSPYRDLITGKMLVSVTAPVHDEGEPKRLLGVAGVDVSLDYLAGMVAMQKIYTSGFGILLNGSGTFLAIPEEGFALSENILVASPAIPEELARVGVRVLSGETGFADVFFLGASQRLFFAPSTKGLFFAILFPKAVIADLVRPLFLRFALVGGGTPLLAILLFYHVARTLLRPVRDLQRTAGDVHRELSRGVDLSETARSVFSLAEGVRKRKLETAVPEFRDMLSSLEEVLVLISRQQEELTAFGQETLAMNIALDEANTTLQKRERVWASILDVFRTVAHSSEEARSLENVAGSIRDVTEAYGVTVGCVEGDAIVPFAASGYDGTGSGVEEGTPERGVMGPAKLEGSVAGRAFRTGEVQWIEHPEQDPEYLEVDSRVASEVEIPILHGGRSLGVIEIAFDKKRSRDEALLETLLPVATALGGLLSAEQSARDLRASYHYLAEKLATVTGIYHDETAEHLGRMEAYCREVASWLGRSQEEQEEIALFARLHDIGKIRVPLSLLSKPGALTPEEFELMRKHTLWGAELIGDAPWLEVGKRICLSHHEKWDGSGYPLGLSGESIPWEGRVVALADVYDALRSPRVYKQGMDHARAVEIILSGDGRTFPGHFDPEVLRLFRERHGIFEKIFESL
ncbi:HD domain-containing phosphohydrolase [Aminiphilus circumscriptus]|uniref:HD domain-containing phosphohydrolase n=1 Tax=Aminiphilus circumscriptus TaxID=290732 RepID=UPI00146F9A9E|nr:HD domain-containing phosphohydrolase [Aminiphilus circumscriptus]